MTLVFSFDRGGIDHSGSVFSEIQGSIDPDFSVIYSIPSLALFALLIPLTGLGMTTTVIVLTAHNQYLLLGNFTAGILGVDSGVTEAARGIGDEYVSRFCESADPAGKRHCLPA